MHLLFTQVHFLFWQLGRGQYTTLIVISWKKTPTYLPTRSSVMTPTSYKVAKVNLKPTHLLPVQTLYSVLSNNRCHTIVNCISLDILLFNSRYWIKWYWGCPRGVMVKVMDCGIVVSEFELQSRYYVYFRTNTLGKGRNALILPPMG